MGFFINIKKKGFQTREKGVAIIILYTEAIFKEKHKINHDVNNKTCNDISRIEIICV